MDMKITKDELVKLTSRPLWHGKYRATDNFKAIEMHACVCFEDGGLVASTGRADDRESQLYAAMFADAPAMLLEIANLRAALEAIENLGAENPNSDMTKEMFKIANDALVSADAAEQSVERMGESLA